MKKHVELIRELGKIKKVKRSGWVREGIQNPESVADHSYRTAIMALVFGKYLDVNTDKLIKMILLHDLGEGSIGDIVVDRGEKTDEKAREGKDKEEIEAVRRIFETIDEGNSFAKLQKESSEMITREARILKQLERLEMAVQALEYEEETGKDLSEFFENANKYIEEPYLKEILKTVISSRPKK